MSIKDDLRISPIKNYIPPSLPALGEAKGNLKTLPARWKKNAAVMACFGLTGAFTLTGCDIIRDVRDMHNGGAGEAPYYVTRPTECDVRDDWFHHGGSPDEPYYVVYQTEQEILAQIQAQIEAASLDLRTHWGGSGAGPFYVAHITEDEAQAFIRARLTAAGLNLDSVPPVYTIFNPGEPIPGMIDTKGIDMFDADKNVAIVNISWENSEMPFSPTGQGLADIVAEEFASRVEGLTFGVFFNPGHTIHSGTIDWDDNDEMVIHIDDVTPEDKEAARYILIQRLTAQVDEFIAHLRAEGIV